ncbi:uncharacterized protein LOC134727623 [Mytilus trossulus]|uniref:uncharacterized protein LOC134727623 n=1 Tax=Mytilus trossulus TaxID=6551 RepID=UPI0030045147
MTAETVASLFDTSPRDKIEVLDVGAGTGLVATQKSYWLFAYCFDCVSTCGCFVPGHLPPDSLYECLRFAKKDGKIVITKRANYDEPQYEQSLISVMDELEVNGKWKKTLEIPIPNYCYDNLGVTYVFTVL